MSWPTATDYQEAIQSPQFCFKDPELRSAQAECNQLGIPKPRAGTFATVYKMVGSRTNWAVRCFNREVADQRERYAAISDQLKESKLPYTVDFSYLDDGIRVAGRWLPSVKMEWVNGEPLGTFVERNLRNSRVLVELAQNWVRMLSALRSVGIAHGDLQDGNVLVVGSQIKLVDYDGMFVPRLRGKLSNETGQPNYQHPLRGASDYGPYIDNFSGWIVLASLLALSRNPGLWSKYKGGDQCLLFRKTDLQNPEKSLLFSELKRSPDSQVGAIASLVEGFLFDSVSNVPDVDNSAFDKLGPTVPTTTPTMPAWMRDHLTPSAKQPVSGTSVADLPVPSNEWVLDFVGGQSVPVGFAESFLRERLFFVAVLGSCAAIFALLGPNWISLVLVCFIASGMLGVFRYRYVQNPIVKESLVYRDEVVEIALVISEQRKKVQQVEKEVARERKVFEDKIAEIQRAVAALSVEEMERSSTFTAVCKKATSSARDQIGKLSQQETAERSSLQNQLGPKVSDLKQKSSRVGLEEADQKRKALELARKTMVDQYLRSKSIHSAGIPGIGSGYKSRLEASGFRTAADINRSVERVSGIGQARARALYAWKDSLFQVVSSRLPTALETSEEAAISAKFQAESLRLAALLKIEEDHLSRSQGELKAKFAAHRAPLEEQVNRAETTLQGNLKALKDEIAGRTKKLHIEITNQQSELDKAVRHTNSTLKEVRSEVMKLQWKKGIADREWARHAGVSFRAYLKKVAVGR